MKANYSITEVRGIPGKMLGVVPIPTSGSMRLKLTGDLLITREEILFGLETKETSIPVREIKAIEIGEGCNWFLFWLGIPTLLIFFIGVIFIVLAFVIKQRYVLIYTHSINLIMFYDKAEKIEPFKSAVLAAFQSRGNAPLRSVPPPPPQNRLAKDTPEF